MGPAGGGGTSSGARQRRGWWPGSLPGALPSGSRPSTASGCRARLGPCAPLLPQSVAWGTFLEPTSFGAWASPHALAAQKASGASKHPAHPTATLSPSPGPPPLLPKAGLAPSLVWARGWGTQLTLRGPQAGLRLLLAIQGLRCLGHRSTDPPLMAQGRVKLPSVQTSPLCSVASCFAPDFFRPLDPDIPTPGPPPAPSQPLRRWGAWGGERSLVTLVWAHSIHMSGQTLPFRSPPSRSEVQSGRQAPLPRMTRAGAPHLWTE